LTYIKRHHNHITPNATAFVAPTFSPPIPPEHHELPGQGPEPLQNRRKSALTRRTLVRAHIALCVTVAVIEAVITEDLARADVRDPEIDDQVMTPRRALAELSMIRLHKLEAGRSIELVNRPTPLQRTILEAVSRHDHGTT
jgi:hypothetical protein